MAKVVSESLIVSAPNAPLDKRTEIDSLSLIGQIENPSQSLIIYDKETEKHYAIKEMADELIPGTTISRKVIKSVEPLSDDKLDYDELEDVNMDDVFDQEGVETMDVADAPNVDFDSLK